MPKIKYQEIKLNAAKLAVVAHANEIIEEYQAQGFDLTLRQLYYQFVSRDLLPNRQQEYKRLGDIINDARLAGLVDWLAIVDRTRNLRDLSHWDDPPEILTTVAEQFRIDKWATQQHRVEVWIEKDALVGVIEGVCQEMDVPFFSCRGYTSQSEMWVAAQRIIGHASGPVRQSTVILHFGDHDPSGCDMSRDIEDRLRMFTARRARDRFELRRLALNMDQIQQYSPPPNPAKTTDARYAGYQGEHGDESWELDALEPSVLAGLIRAEIESLRDDRAWARALDEEAQGRQQLGEIAARYDEVTTFLGEAE